MKILVIDDQVMEFMGIMDSWVTSKVKNPKVSWECATSGEAGINILKNKTIYLVLIDGNLINEQGYQVVQEIRESGNKVYLCMFSSDIKQNELGLSSGANFSIDKGDFLNGCFSELISEDQQVALDKMAAIITLAGLRQSL